MSAGRLGVISSLSLRIVPNAQVRRISSNARLDDFLGRLAAVQAGWNANGTASPAVQALDTAIYLWHIPRGKNAPDLLSTARLEWVDPLAKPVPTDARPAQLESPFARGALTDAALAASAGGDAEGEQPQPAATAQLGNHPGLEGAAMSSPTLFADSLAAMLAPALQSGTYPLREAVVTEPESVYHFQTSSYQYDQYEVRSPCSPQCKKRRAGSLAVPSRLFVLRQLGGRQTAV